MTARREGHQDCDWSRASYEVRARETIYLWGSAGLAHDVTFVRPLILHVQNDAHGEVITIGTRASAGTMTPLGTLQPGETVSIPVQGISGVFAQCALESTVRCLIRESP